MKTLGIDINGNTAVFCSIEENTGIIDITGKMTKLELKDDESSQEIHEFVDVIHSHFNEMQFDKIAILKRAKSLKAKSKHIKNLK
jgi:formylmethanofuran dehydrogenase subunit C